MKKVIAIILVACLCLPLAFGGLVVAQETTQTSTDTDTTTETNTEQETESSTEQDTEQEETESGVGDQSAEETAKDLWTLYVESENTDTPQQTTIQRQFGPTIYLLDHKWDQDQGNVQLTLRVTEQTDVTFTDSSGVFASGVMKGAKRSMTLPAGTYNVLIPATPQESSYQAISVDPDTEEFVYGLDTGDAGGGDSPFSRSVAIKYTLFGIVGLTSFSVLIVGYKLRNKGKDGKITTSDGTEISGGKVYGDLMETRDTEYGGENDD